MASFREVEYMERPRRRRRRRRRWPKALVTLALVCVLAAAAWKFTDGLSAFSLPVKLGLENADTGFSYDLGTLEGLITDEMYLGECGAEEAAELRELAEENADWSEELEFMASHIGIYSEEAVVTALNGPEKTPFALLSAFRAPDDSGLEIEFDLEDGELPYLLQYDSRWCFHGYGSSVIGFTGCGPTCLSMAAIGLTGNTAYTPAYVADMSEAGGHYVMGAGTAWSLFTAGAAQLGLSSETVVVDKSAMKERLSEGAVLVAAMLPGDFTTSGHFILIYGTALTGGFKVYDPNSIERSERTWSFSRLEPQISQLWSLSLPGGSESGGASGYAEGEVFVADCEEFITLRAEPDVNAEALATIPKLGEMRLIRFTGAFAEVEYQGLKGYVLSTYIAPKSGYEASVSSFGYGELESELQSLAAGYPGEMELLTIGQSLEGRNIYAAVVGEPGAEHDVLLQACIHGRENIGAYLLLCQLRQLLEQGAPEGLRFHFIPMVNPDGAEISRTAELGEAQREIYLSELASGLTGLSEPAYASRWKANAAGVDLNRNFDAGWAGLPETSFSSEGCKGLSPEDQPESRALAEYARALMPDATVSYHSSGSLIYCEYEGASAEVNAASRELARALGAAAGYPIEDVDGLDAGGFKDWAASELGIPSVTVELGYGDDPQRPGSYAAAVYRNLSAPAVIADWLG